MRTVIGSSGRNCALSYFNFMALRLDFVQVIYSGLVLWVWPFPTSYWKEN